MALFMALNGVEVVLPEVVIFVLLVTISVVLAFAYYGKMKAPAVAGVA